MKFKLKLSLLIISLISNYSYASDEFKDSVVLITGASGDIGCRTAQRFLERGAFVIGQYNKNSKSLDDLKKSYAGRLELIFGNAEQITNFGNVWFKAIQINSNVNVVVNALGVLKPSKDPMEIDVRIEAMLVNYHAPVLISDLAIEHFKKNKLQGVIVNLGSRAGYRGMPEGFYHYADSKAAFTIYTQQIARDNAAFGIIAAVVAPGPVEGRMLDSLTTDARAKSLASMPSGKPVTLDEVAEMILFIASRKAPSATGGVFDLMGGSYFH